MSVALDVSIGMPTAQFQGQVRDTSYYTTAKDDKYLLVYVRGVTKPLAMPAKWPCPTHGNFVNARGVSEGRDFFFVGHRSIVEISAANRVVWKHVSKVDKERREQAYEIIRSHLRNWVHCMKCDTVWPPGTEICEVCQSQGKTQFFFEPRVSSNDVSEDIQLLFPERDPQIVGAFFLGLSKKGEIHICGEKPSEDPRHNGSPIRIWHLVKT